jgi:Flp pilus assembly protein TadG
MPKLLHVHHCRCALLSALVRDRRGATAVAIALSLTALAGLGGLATEGGSWYFTSRTMQSAADAAAFTAALAKAASDGTTNYRNEAKWIAANYNFVDGSGSTVTINSPPLSGSHASDSSAVEVVISQTQTPLLSSLFMSSGPTIKARAVATSAINASGCVLTLDRGNVVDLDNTGNANLTLTNCSVYVNSDDPSGALTMTGNASITASGAYVVGGISTTGNASLNTNNNTHTHSTPINDPYGNVALPTKGGCDPAIDGSQSTIHNPTGVYKICGGGINLSANSSVTLDPGIYIVSGGSVSLSGNSTLSGTGVTIVLTGSGSNWATVKISGNGNMTITAPTSGQTQGMAFYQDRSTPLNTNNGASFSGNGSLSVTGAIYLPNNNVTFTGNGGANAPQCTQLVALTATFHGNGNLKNNCSGVGVTPFGNSAATFIE